LPKGAEFRQFIERLSRFYCGVVCDILDELHINGFMRGISLQSSLPESGKIVAPAITVQFRKTLALRVQWKVHEGIDIGANHIMVIDADYQNGGRGSVFGGLMSLGAQVNGLLGTIVDGTVRDISEVRRLGYPLYARGVEPLTAHRRLEATGLNVTIECAGVKVAPGDIIFGDADGVVCIPQAALPTVVDMGERLFNKENNFEKDMREGKSLLETFSPLKKLEEI
jgi:4-hydroxy-4-methyl-2-oxoglutarate aldolase